MSDVIRVEGMSDLDSVISQPAMDAIPFPAYLFRADGVVMRVNRAGEEFWGVPAAATVGTFSMYDHPGDDPAVVPAMREAFAGRSQTLKAVEVDLEKISLGHISQKRAWLENVFCPVKEA